MNTSIEKSISVPYLRSEEKLHCRLSGFTPGGGINVSRVIKKLGGESECWYLAGGYHGDFFSQLTSGEL